MSGPRIHVDYQTDIGTTISVSMPQWAATMVGASAGSSTTPKPAGLRPRKRYVRITATGREKSVICPDESASFWTNGFGTAVSVPVLGSGTPAAGTLEGRTGERTKHI